MVVYGVIDQITGSPSLAIVFLGVFFVTAVFFKKLPKKGVLNE
jgi:UMF1 family MFS transporter